MRSDRIRLFSTFAVAVMCFGQYFGVSVDRTMAAENVTLSIEAFEFTSCPFVYSWDGEKYQIENDIYSVGRGAQKEFTDYLSILRTVVPKDGMYSFEIREVGGETSWTDVLKLIAIDHPANVRVGVDSSGNVHSYGTPFAPDSAVDGEGNDVLEKITAQDDITVDMYHDSTVILDFTSVDVTAAAKLVMDLNGFEGKSGGGFIPATPTVQIQTLEAGDWVTRHSFFPKEEWAEGVFDLTPYLDESKSVRLVGVSCFGNKYHMVDYVGLDNTPDKISYEILDPVSAKLNDTVDILYEVTDSDDFYVNMVPGDTLTIAFPYNMMADESRSFAFISEGYYEQIKNTYFVDTWNGSAWIERASKSWDNSMADSTEDFDLSSYLPDSDAEYKVRIRNSLTPGSYGEAEAEVDYIKLTVEDCSGSQSYNPSYAQQYSPALNILDKVSVSDNLRWNALNRSALIKFNATPNQAPVAECQDIILPLGPDGTASINASDIDGGSSDPDGDSITLSASQTSFVCSDIGFNTVTLTVNDGQCIDTCAANITVVDNLPSVPNVNPLPQVTGQCSATISAAPTATDNCAGTVTGTTSDPLSYSEQGTHTVTWTFDDGNGNTSTQPQQVVVQDTVAPIPDTSSLPQVTGQCSAAIPAAPTATDNCAGTVTGTTSDPLSYNEQGTYTVTWTFDDGNGNTAIQTQQVVVQDTVAPTVITKNIAVELDENGNASISVDDIDNGSTDNCCLGSKSISKSNFTCADLGENTVTLTVNDCNGNSSTAPATVTVEDNIAPVVKTKNITVELDADGNASITPEDIDDGSTDNCGIASMTVAPSEFTCSDLDGNTVTLTVTDNNGNVAEETAAVTVLPYTIPVSITGVITDKPESSYKDVAVFKMTGVTDIGTVAMDAAATGTALTFEFRTADKGPLYSFTADSFDAAGNRMIYSDTEGNMVRCIFSTERCVVRLRYVDVDGNALDTSLPGDMTVNLQVGCTKYSNTGDWQQYDSGSGTWTKYRKDS